MTLASGKTKTEHFAGLNVGNFKKKKKCMEK